MYPPDDQNAILRLDFAACFCNKFASARVDFARLQRAPEGPQHSTSRCRNDVVNRGAVRFSQGRSIYSIVLCDRTVNAERDDIVFAGQMRCAQRTFLSFESDVGSVDDLRH